MKKQFLVLLIGIFGVVQLYSQSFDISEADSVGSTSTPISQVTQDSYFWIVNQGASTTPLSRRISLFQLPKLLEIPFFNPGLGFTINEDIFDLGGEITSDVVFSGTGDFIFPQGLLGQRLGSSDVPFNEAFIENLTSNSLFLNQISSRDNQTILVNNSLDFNNAGSLINLIEPLNPTDAATKQYSDSKIAGKNVSINLSNPSTNESGNAIVWNNSAQNYELTPIQTSFPLNGSSGSANEPTYSFIGNENTGFFNSGLNKIGFSTEGVERIDISNDGLNVKSGNLSVSDVVRIDAAGNGYFQSFTNNGITYPSNDGSIGDVITTNGSGTLSFTSVDLQSVLSSGSSALLATDFSLETSASTDFQLIGRSNNGDGVFIRSEDDLEGGFLGRISVNSGAFSSNIVLTPTNISFVSSGVSIGNLLVSPSQGVTVNNANFRLVGTSTILKLALLTVTP